MKKDIQKKLLTVTLMLILTACGNGNSALPDDPTSEPAIENTIEENAPISDEFENPPEAPAAIDSILQKYSYVDPTRMIQSRHLSAALSYYDQNKSRIRNTKYLSVIDFSKSSKQKRFFIINMSTGAVWAIHTAHGKGSDTNHDGYAESFSNLPGSNASSLGFYLTAETYSGKYGYSLRLDGLSTTNSNARRRAIVIHAASYVQESSVIQGRSWGCPAVAPELRTKVIDLIKNGSLIYASK